LLAYRSSKLCILEKTLGYWSSALDYIKREFSNAQMFYALTTVCTRGKRNGRADA